MEKNGNFTASWEKVKDACPRELKISDAIHRNRKEQTKSVWKGHGELSLGHTGLL